MMSLRKIATPSTISWQQHARQTGEGNHQLVLAESEAEPPSLDLNQLLRIPFEFMFARLQAGICRELDTFADICTSHARAFDEVYLGHARRFQGTVSGKYEEIMSEFQSKLGG